MSDVDAKVRELVRCGGSLQARRTAAIFVAGYRMHYIRQSSFAEQPYGLIAKCERCDAVVKVLRQPTGPEGIEGSITERDCQARPT